MKPLKPWCRTSIPTRVDTTGRAYNTHHNDSLTDHLAIELGAGLNVPAGNTTTWQAVGYSINLGGGWMFNDRFGVLAEYSFNRAQYSDQHADQYR